MRSVLDLFCGAGGSAMGLKQAGFDEIVGVDHDNKSGTYPFTFFQGDALDALRYFALPDFDLIWASPPCQPYSRLKARHWKKSGTPDYIKETRALCEKSGRAFIIENVENAPLKRERSVMLCGTMFEKLKVYKHRVFEFGNMEDEKIKQIIAGVPEHREHTHREDFMMVAGHFTGRDEGRKAMGIDWMSRNDLSQAIPPAYSRWIGLAITI